MQIPLKKKIDNSYTELKNLIGDRLEDVNQQIKYKLDFYSEFERLIHFLLLDFKLNKELKESIEKVVIRIINTPTILDSKELKF